MLNLVVRETDPPAAEAVCAGSRAAAALRGMEMVPSAPDPANVIGRLSAQLRDMTTMLDAIGDGVVAWNAHGRIHYANPGAHAALGVAPGALAGHAIDAVLPLFAADPSTDSDRAWSARRDEITLADGSVHLLESSLGALPEGGHVLVLRDITERGEAERRIHSLAHFDALTGLPNRGEFIERVADAAARPADGGFAILHFDLFNFKDVNEAVGHAGGDRLLAEIGRRVRERLGPAMLVARIGGDEYAVLAPGAGDAAAATALAEQVFEAVESAGGSAVVVSSSMGIALYPEHGTDVGTLLGNANMALYHAKPSGKRASVIFSRELERSTRERAELERELRGALERGELRLEYQPKYHLAFGKVAGAEALLRWRHPVLGDISPVRFIPVAEASQLIIPIGRWVVAEVCRQIRAWEAEGLPPLQIALNLSPVQFRSDSLFDDIIGILQDAEVMPGQIELEITESLLMDKPDAAVDLLTRLRAAGFSLAIDDFGTGYSSLAYLKKFPVAVLKIDRSFVKDLASDMGDRAIAASVVGLAGSLLLDVVAEGVEVVEQVDLLRDMGCDYVQGYHISRPLAPADFARFVRDSLTHGVEYARLARQTVSTPNVSGP